MNSQEIVEKKLAKLFKKIGDMGIKTP